MQRMLTRSISHSNILSRYFLLVYVAVVGGFITGCQETVSSILQLQAYVEDEGNGLTKLKQTAVGSIIIQYVPAEIMAYQEIANNPQAYPTAEATDSLYQAFRNNIYLKLQLTQHGRSLEVNASGDPTQAAGIRTHLMSGIVNDVYLRENLQEQVSPTGHFYIATPLSESATTVLFVFKRTANLGVGDDLEVYYRDKILGFGTHEFKFKAYDVTAVPTLKY
jgi:hypothetical protein